MSMGRKSMLSNGSNVPKIVAEIEGQLAFFDFNLRQLGHHRQPVDWSVIKRIMDHANV